MSSDVSQSTESHPLPIYLCIEQNWILVQAKSTDAVLWDIIILFTVHKMNLENKKMDFFLRDGKMCMKWMHILRGRLRRKLD